MTAKKTAANKANSLKSTGPKTPEGKAVVAMNGIRHGILSQRLLLASEAPDEFMEFLESLQAALRPSGALELVLVDKIAAAVWRQRRLVAAETASIELERRLDNYGIGQSIEKVTHKDFEVSMMAELSDEDRVQIKWCRDVLAEFEALDDAVLEGGDIKRLQAEAPLMYRQLLSEAVEEQEPVPQYLSETTLRDWCEEVQSFCQRELSKLEGRPMVREVANLVQQKASAPVSNELLPRYQAALDNELYKALRALREQQEWRMRGGIEVEAA